MSNEIFSMVSRIFGGRTISEDQESELFKETLIMALSRMTRADLTIEPIEVQSVIEFVKHATGAEISDNTIRVAASSELFESDPLEKHLKKVSKHLSAEHRVKIMEGLKHIIGSDGKVTSNEADFFNSLIDALGLSAAQIAGLTVE
ncbi:MAG: TerB family tellurite resistance protein [Pseudomonadota bacterium]